MFPLYVMLLTFKSHMIKTLKDRWIIYIDCSLGEIIRREKEEMSRVFRVEVVVFLRKCRLSSLKLHGFCA